MDYDKLLDRARASIPEKEKLTSGERFETPRATLLVQGNKTIITNFGDISSRIRRTEAEFAKYLFKELAVPGEVQAGRLVLAGKFSDRVVNDRIQNYVATAVICKECGKPDTRLEAVDRHLKMLICEACGAKAPVRL
jgi:translation initiation factor 2 subunit 2